MQPFECPSVAYLAEQLRDRGVHFMQSTVEGCTDTSAFGRRHLQIRSEDGTHAVLAARAVVLAVGPYLKRVGRLFGVEFPVINEAHAKVHQRVDATKVQIG